MTDIGTAAPDFQGPGAVARRPVSCPMCGTRDAETMFPLDAAALLRCARCGLAYVSPRADSAILQARLQHWAEKDVVDSQRLDIAFEPATLALYGRFLDLIERCGIKPPARLLDIGCATGALLQVARDRNWAVHGLEVGRASATYARTQLDLPVDNTSMFEADFPDGSFDAVTLVEVIEHLEEPALALERIHHWLRPDGILLVTTPNLDALFRRLFGPRWWVVNCEDEHIVLFTPDTLQRMLEQHGYDVLLSKVRGIDIAGLFRAARESLATRRQDTGMRELADTGYYEMRADKQRAKDLARRLGLLGVVRWGLRALDHLFSKKSSPFYAWGEQLVLVARKRPRP